MSGALWTASEVVTLRDLVRYAGASGDLNPIHYDKEFALSRGLPNVIVHGLFTTGIVARLVRANAPHPVRITSLSARFVGVLVPDREIVFTARRADGDGSPGEHLEIDVRHAGAERSSVLCRSWAEPYAPAQI